MTTTTTRIAWRTIGNGLPKSDRGFASGWGVSGLRVDSVEPGQLFGADPRPRAHGPANVTWIIRWRDREERDAAWDALWQDGAWKALWARHPGFEGYRQLSVRFLDEV